MAARKPPATEPAPRPPAPQQSAGPTIALALGGGGARGLGHIPMLEAFDELGLRPKVIAGTSIGAIFGAAYASGLSARDIRAHTKAVLSQRFDLMREVFSARARPLTRIWSVLSANSSLLAADVLLDTILPRGVCRSFAELDIPLKIVATDFYGQEPVVFSEGPLRHAIAASIALPVIFEPVIVEGRVLIDGGLVNPLPFDLVLSEADLTVAIDVSGAPFAREGQAQPKAWQALFASPFIFERTIIKEKLKSSQPDIYIDAGTHRFQTLDFLRFEEILAAAEPAKDRLKAQLERVLAVPTLQEIALPIAAAPGAELLEEPTKRRLLPRPRRKSRA